MFDAERSAIEGRFNTLWGTTTPVKYENVAFSQPRGVPWVALTIINVDARPTTLSGGTERHTGLVFVQVFDLLDQGQARARTLAEQAAAIFRNVLVTASDGSTITFRTPTLVTIGSREGLFQMNMRVPYLRLSNA